jgi:hypothetical protein
MLGKANVVVEKSTGHDGKRGKEKASLVFAEFLERYKACEGY